MNPSFEYLMIKKPVYMLEEFAKEKCTHCKIYTSQRETWPYKVESQPCNSLQGLEKLLFWVDGL